MDYFPIAFLNIFLQIFLVIIIPMKIIKAVYVKTGKIKRIFILPFFISNWFLQAFLNVILFKIFFRTLMYDVVAGFLSWLCDSCVFILPIIACFIARSWCSNIELEKVNVETEEYQAVDSGETNVVTQENSDKPLFCRKCGYELLGNSRFCRKCGIEVILEENYDSM